MDYLEVELVSPDKLLYKDQAYEVVLPTTTGEIAVLPNHIPLISNLAAGEVVIKKSAEERNHEYYVISGGFVEVTKNKIRVLANTAEHAKDIDEAKAEEAHRNAQKIMQEAKNDVDFSGAAAALEKATARLRVVRKHKRSHHNFQT